MPPRTIAYLHRCVWLFPQDGCSVRATNPHASFCYYDCSHMAPSTNVRCNHFHPFRKLRPLWQYEVMQGRCIWVAEDRQYLCLHALPCPRCQREGQPILLLPIPGADGTIRIQRRPCWLTEAIRLCFAALKTPHANAAQGEAKAATVRKIWSCPCHLQRSAPAGARRWRRTAAAAASAATGHKT